MWPSVVIIISNKIRLNKKKVIDRDRRPVYYTSMCTNKYLPKYIKCVKITTIDEALPL